MERVLDVAQYIFEWYKKISGETIDEMKLHKLLYFAQREMLAITGEPIFAEEFEGWRYGPVLTEVRYAFTPDGINDPSGGNEVSPETAYVLNNVLSEYASIETWKLSEMSHKERSWQNAREGLLSSENGTCKLKLADIKEDAKKIRPYDTVYDMYYDEFEDAEAG